MIISAVESVVLSELQSSRENLVCVPIEGASDDIEGNVVDVPTNLTVDFLRNHILIQKGTLWSQNTIPEVNVGADLYTYSSRSLTESIKLLARQRSEFLSQQDSGSKLHVFLVKTHEGN